MHTKQFVKMIKPLNEQYSYDAAIKENPNNSMRTLSGGRRKRSIGYYSKFWENGRTITVSFMQDLSDDLEYRIERIIRQWEPHLSLAFEFVEGRQGEIRIALDSEHNESCLGTDALIADPNEPTLSLAAKPDDSTFEQILLHEFGHALGLLHAHLHPEARIPWNKEKVYNFYKTTWGWSESDINHNLFDFETGPDIYLGDYDKKSIMHYPIPNELTLGDWEVGINLTLSAQDKINTRKIYPPL